MLAFHCLQSPPTNSKKNAPTSKSSKVLMPQPFELLIQHTFQKSIHTIQISLSMSLIEKAWGTNHTT